MNEKKFEMKLSCGYTGDENDVTRLQVDLFEEGAWEAFSPGLESPGFLIFVYAIFHCQHRLFRVTAARRRLGLHTARGSIKVVTDGNWRMKTLQVGFEGTLRAGKATQQDIELVVDAMKNCPVSVNLGEGVETSSTVTFN